MIRITTRHLELAALGALAIGLVAAVLVAPRVTALYEGQASAQAGVTVTGVAPNQSSAKIYFQPVAGAKDYRVYDVANPNDVKYAGMAYMIPGPSCPGYACFYHFVTQADGVTPVFPYQIANGASGGPQVLNVPATDVEWNGLGDGQVHTLVVEAVDALGPVPQANLYSGQGNTPLAPAGMLGSNKGQTADGKLSTNGQGPFSNNPKVIAVSSSFVVQANSGLKAIPSSASAGQAFYDTFDNAEGATLHQTARDDGQRLMTYSLNAGTPKESTIEYRDANNRDSMPFIASDHFMDMLFDGATPGVPAPTHTSYGSMAMTPSQTVDISGGKVLHMTMEVDAHQSFRRWVAFNLAPATDPLTGFNPFGSAINQSDRGIFLEMRDGQCTLGIYTGPKAANDPSPLTTQAWTCGWEQMFNTNDLDVNGLGRLDSRSRLDFFISQTHAALFQDDKLITQADIPAGTFTWANQPIKTYFTHYIYHSSADVGELLGGADINGAKLCYPLNSYWFNDPLTGSTACGNTYPAGYGFPYSDERHWDNMGFEVLNASVVPAGDFSGFASMVQLPQARAPQFVGDGNSNAPVAPVAPVVPVSSPTPTATPLPIVSAAMQDGSLTWVNINPPGVSTDYNNPPNNFGFNSIATDPVSPGTVYVGTNYQGIFKSTDRGNTWVKIDSGAGSNLIDAGRVWSLVVDPFNHMTVWASSGAAYGGPLKSTDGGVSWTHMLPPGNPTGAVIKTNDVVQIVLDPYMADHLLVAFHYYWYDSGDSGVLESFDGGASWIVHNPPAGSGWGAGNSVWFLDNSQTWLAASQGAGYWRTTTSGQAWTQVSTSSIGHGGTHSLYREPSTGVLYAAIWNGILRSTDNGVTWQDFGASRGLPYAAYETLIGNGTSLFTAPSAPTGGDDGQAHGPWSTIAEDGSTSWSAFKNQAPCSNGICNGPVEMASDPDGTIYSANWNGGVWRLQTGVQATPANTPAQNSAGTPAQPGGGSGSSGGPGGSGSSGGSAGGGSRASARGSRGSTSGGGGAMAEGGGGSSPAMLALNFTSNPSPRPQPPQAQVAIAPSAPAAVATTASAPSPSLVSVGLDAGEGALSVDRLSITVPAGVGGTGGAELNVLRLDASVVPPAGDGFNLVGDSAFLMTLTDRPSGEKVVQLNSPLTLEYRLSPSEIGQAGGNPGRVKLATWSGDSWVAFSCTVSGSTLLCSVPRLSLFALVQAPAPADILDAQLDDGWFYKQANGFDGAGDTGFAIVDDADASFWTEFQRLGGIEKLGYPISTRFQYGGLLTQAFQRAALQWRPDLNQAVPIDIFDELATRGTDHWLDVARLVPPAGIDTGQAADEDNVARQLSLLDAYPALRAYYQAEPGAWTLFGLPRGVKQYGSLVTMRLQRGFLQLWTTDATLAPDGSVVSGNAGDLAKEVGLWPADAIIPTPAPTAVAPEAAWL